MFDFDRLMTLAKEQKRSASFLCECIHRANNYINDLKRLHRDPTPDVISTWAEALHTTPAYLLGETDEKNKPAIQTDDELLAEISKNPDKLMLAQWISRMNEDQLQRVLKLLDAALLQPRE